MNIDGSENTPDDEEDITGNGSEDAPDDDSLTKIEAAEKLFARNMENARVVAPELHASLKNHKPISKITWLENDEPDVTFQDFSMYPEGAITHAKKQVDQLERHSIRLHMNRPSAEGLDHHSGQAFNEMVDRFEQSGLQFAPLPVRESAYFLIVFGVGLGQHLTELVERSQCRALILVEPNVDLLYHSMSVFDWEALFERFSTSGTIEFIVSIDPKEIGNSIKSVFRRWNPVGMDGTLVFRHYSGTIFQEVERDLSDTLRTAIMGLGFFQDEINMIGQSYKNLEKGDSRVITKITETPLFPVFIIGSGPSIEALLPFIEENQDKAIIISCGTSVDILLEHGITPDFWAIAERDYDILLQAQETDELYGTKDIHFAGSTTIFPGVYERFKDAIFFFRPGLSSTPLFAKSWDQIVSMPDPLAANAGLSVAIHLGFREIYFMGVDTGSKYQSHGHANNTWYTRHDAENIKDLSIPIPGNFGGTVWTTAELQWSKENIERLLSFSPGCVAYNLGDGALIKGVAPKHPKAVKLKTPSSPKAEAVRNLIEQCPPFEKSDFDDRWERSAVIDRIFGLSEELKKAAATENDPNDYEFIHRTINILKPDSTHNPESMVIRGTLFLFLIGGYFYANRLNDPAELETLSQILRDGYCKLVDQMLERTVEIFKELEEGMTWEQFYE